MTTTTIQPTIVLRIGESHLTKSERGEIMETVDLDSNGNPDWDSAGICDPRGMGSEEGFAQLVKVFDAAERNAELIGQEITRLPD